MLRRFALATVATLGVASCTEIPPPEQPYAAMPAVRRLKVAIATPNIANADRSCRPEALDARLVGELDGALKAAGYAVVNGGPFDLTVRLELDATECGTLDASVDAAAEVRLTATAGAALLFDGKEPFYATKSASVQAITYADWAPRIVNDLSRSTALMAFALGPQRAAPSAVATVSTAPMVAPIASASALPVQALPSFGWKPGSAHAEARALVIGVEAYRELPRAVGARRDAEKFADLATTTLGVPKDRVTRLLDEEATRPAVDAALAALAKASGKGDRVYVSFSGEGSTDVNRSAKLELYDAPGLTEPTSSLAVSAVIDDLRGLKGPTVVLFIDASFAGTGARAVPAKEPRLPVPFDANLPAGFVVIAASKRGEKVGLDAAGTSGLFSSVIAEALGGGAADIDGDGNISLGELVTWARPRIARASKDQGLAQTLSVTEGPGVGDPGAFALATGLSR